MSNNNYLEFELSKFDVIFDIPKFIKCNVNGPWLCGGFLRHKLLVDNKQSDIDYFFQNEDQLYYIQSLLEGMDNIQLASDTTNALTYKLDNKPSSIQLIRKRFFYDISSVLEAFDYTICQFGYNGNNIVTNFSILNDLHNMRLVHNEDVSVMKWNIERLYKFVLEGFKPDLDTLKFVLPKIDPKLKEKVKLLESDV